MRHIKSVLGDWFTRSPVSFLIVLAAVVVAAVFIYGRVESYIFERGVRKADEVRVERRQKETKYKEASDAAYGEAEAHRKQADESERKLAKIEQSVKEKKDNVKNLEDTTAASGTRDIDDPDVPSNLEQCRRANSLGVRCDYDR